MNMDKLTKIMRQMERDTGKTIIPPTSGMNNEQMADINNLASMMGMDKENVFKDLFGGGFGK